MGKTIFADRPYIDKKMEELHFGMIDYFNKRFKMLETDILAALGIKAEDSAPQPEKPQEKEIKAVSEQMEEEPEWMIWKMKMSRRVGEIVKQFPGYYTNGNDLLRIVYRKMNTVYGFVAEQERKQYKDPCGASNKKPSTLEIIAYNPQYRSIFEAVLENIAEGARVREEKEKAVTMEMLATPHQDIIKPLLDARGDKSNCGCVTYTIVYKRMKRHGADFETVEADYRKQFEKPKGKVSKGSLIEHDSGLKKKFIESVTELMLEIKNQPEEKQKFNSGDAGERGK